MNYSIQNLHSDTNFQSKLKLLYPMLDKRQSNDKPK